LKAKAFLPADPDLLPRRLPLFSFSPAVILQISAASPICHPVNEWRESSGISGEKRRKGGSKENKEERKKTERRKGREEGEEGDGRGVKRE